MNTLIVGRVIAGVGGCGIYAGGLNYVAILTTNHERPLYLAGIYSMWGVGLAVNFGGTVFAWDSGSEIALLVLTGVFLVAFIGCTAYHPGVPKARKLLPVGFMTTVDLVIIPLQGAIVAGAMFTAIYYTPLLFQFTKADGPLEGGVRILPLICSLVVFALLNAFLMPKTGYYMPWYVAGNAAMVVGSALMVTLESHTSTSKIYGYTILIGIGIGCFQSAGVAVVSAIVPASEVSNAVSIMTIAQVSGILAALSITGAVFQNLVVGKVGSVLPGYSQDDIVHLTTGTSSSLFRGLDAGLKEAVIAQVTESIRHVFIYVLAVSSLGLVLSFFLSRKRLYLKSGEIAK
ncbi:unnamed protein product [Parascedosporium putredinis]|uniref:Uncharacterized protein n=1 Tax=Parascedosporium putredinis TaxID=1442378 RepID=A0A9P1H2N8_9PEZI|nr:unnamed protein product [Parascedosporium putredinis]CAI7993749.1 unnamed protein product [Parascedosporium putredinis]